jgi:hypothetical protein
MIRRRDLQNPETKNCEDLGCKHIDGRASKVPLSLWMAMVSKSTGYPLVRILMDSNLLVLSRE